MMDEQQASLDYLSNQVWNFFCYCICKLIQLGVKSFDFLMHSCLAIYLVPSILDAL